MYFIGSGLKEWLPVGLATAESKDLQLSVENVELAAHQTMWPVVIDGNQPIQESNLSLRIGSAQKDDQRLRGRPGHRLEQERTRWCGVNAAGVFGTMGLHKGLGSGGQAKQRAVTPPVPDFELPEIIVTFDFSLEASFARWDKDRHHARAEAQMD